MARTDLGAIANRLYDHLLAPLVLGGGVQPGRPIGARAALAMGASRVVADSALFAEVQRARTRVARGLVPKDRLPAPTPEEWAIGAALHDLVQASHPSFDAALRRGGPPKILEWVEATLARVPAPRSVGEALARHTWFSRLFELTRTDTVVSWWVGSRTFLGETPPARLSAWPELRRVRVEATGHGLMELPGAGGAVDPATFGARVTELLARTPLTDLATCHRAAPEFAWGDASLGLLTTAAGRVLVTRAMAKAPKAAVDAGLGRATRALLGARALEATAIVLDLLAERALLEAERPPDPSSAPSAPNDPRDDAALARCLGAIAACAKLSDPKAPFAPGDREDLLARLTPLASSALAARTKLSLFGPTSSC